MILVTVGTQYPFDRLVEAVDRWAGRNSQIDIVAQIGPSDYRPSHMDAHRLMAPAHFDDFQHKAGLLIAHCGMGSILAALVRGQPILVMPRRHSLGEHRNDHQVATARRFASFPGVHVAADEHELAWKLDRLATLTASDPISPRAPVEFSTKLASFIAGTSN